MLNIEQLQTQISTINTQIVSIKTNIVNLESFIMNKKINLDSFEYTISDDEFDEILDCKGVQHTSVGSFYPSNILKSCDPIAYRCSKSDYEGNYDLDDCDEYQELQDELENLESDLDTLQDDLEALQDELDELNDQLDELNDQLDELESE